MKQRFFDDLFKARKVRQMNERKTAINNITLHTKIAKSNVNFAFSKPHIFYHNTRDEMPSYALSELKELNSYSLSSDEAQNKFNELLAEARKNYYERTKQKIQTKDEKLRISAVININENHTLADVERVAKKIEEKFGIQVIQCAIHRDEGHFLKNENDEYVLDERGNRIWDLNLHAHIEFFALDKNGINRYKKRDWYKMGKELQDIGASELGMERGKNYAKSGQKAPKGLNRRQYATKRAIEDRQKVKIKDFNAINNELREHLKQSGANRSDYAKLEQEKKDLLQKIKANELSAKELQAWKQKVYDEIESLRKQNSSLESENSSLKEQNSSLKNENSFYKENFAKAEQAIKSANEIQSKNADIYELLNAIAKKCANSLNFRNEMKSSIFDKLPKENTIVRELKNTYERTISR
nr:hypothetical protein [uncultured Campylobacter sp.]